METALREYTSNSTLAGAERLAQLSDHMIALIDLDAVASASRREIGILTAAYLMDIFGRIAPPDPTQLPDISTPDGDRTYSYRIEGTPIRISRVKTGGREGEYLFSPSTVHVAPRFFRSIEKLVLRTSVDTESYSDLYPHLTGPLIPAWFMQGLPEPLLHLWLGTPVWKIPVIAALAFALLFLILRLQRFLSTRAPANRIGALAWRMILPLAALGAVTIVVPLILRSINVSGDFARIMDIGQTVLGCLTYAWLFWVGVRALFEWIILSPRIPDEGLDANLLRLVSGIIGIIGVATILAFGGQEIGLPILSVLAGLGIGGLAVALALRPTLENLVGGVMLYFDRPVRVGDFCSFGTQRGTVEAIGIRSTKLRALDRTLISVPNAQFADMQIVNWAQCDQLLIDETIGVRLETAPDQLRYLLVRIREMLHAHPRIDSDTIRVRFTGYGTSAFNINIRIYAVTREWNDFFAIREDIFLRIYDVITDSGTKLAFPSQTLYMARDGELDAKRGESAKETVRRWRKSGKLPFPRLTRDEIERLKGSLDYPPFGSPEASGEDPGAVPASERLSVDQEESKPDAAAATSHKNR